MGTQAAVAAVLIVALNDAIGLDESATGEHSIMLLAARGWETLLGGARTRSRDADWARQSDAFGLMADG